MVVIAASLPCDGKMPPKPEPSLTDLTEASLKPRLLADCSALARASLAASSRAVGVSDSGPNASRPPIGAWTILTREQTAFEEREAQIISPAIAPGAPSVWPEQPDNLCFVHEIGDHRRFVERRHIRQYSTRGLEQSCRFLHPVKCHFETGFKLMVFTQTPLVAAAHNFLDTQARFHLYILEFGITSGVKIKGSALLVAG